MRVAVYGTKHDASLFEELLKQASQFQALGTIGDTMIDTACLNIPKASLFCMVLWSVAHWPDFLHNPSPVLHAILHLSLTCPAPVLHLSFTCSAHDPSAVLPIALSM